MHLDYQNSIVIRLAPTRPEEAVRVERKPRDERLWEGRGALFFAHDIW
jgi:hypothetical protein